MSTHALRPWTDLVKLHPDVEAGALTEAVFVSTPDYAGVLRHRVGTLRHHNRQERLTFMPRSAD